MANEPSAHTWKFFRVGGLDQVRLDSGRDLLALDQLDQKLWVALSCPVQGTALDEKTLALIDTDKDGKIRVPEVLAAVKWAGSVLRDPAALLAGAPALKLASIDAEGEEGKRLLASAKEILKNLGKKGAKEITLDDTADTAKIFAETKFNGDGVLPPASADDEAVQKAITEILDCMGGELDRSGAQGVTQAKVDAFFTEAQAHLDWTKAGEADAGNLLPLADGGAVATFRALKAKVDDYFARCRLVAFDARAEGAVNRDQAEYLTLAANDLAVNVTEVRGFPLARVAADKPLPLDAGLNPAWAEAVHRLRDEVVKPLLGEGLTLTEASWTGIVSRFAAIEAWNAAKVGAVVEKLGVPRLRELVSGDLRATITALVAKDQALEPEATAIASVEKLIRYHRDLSTLLHNFVSFRDFYSRKKKAIFQAGTLYLDRRSCDLTVQVADAAAHAAIATTSGTFLVYCTCNRKGSGEVMTIAAAFTAGDSDALAVGRNGIFYDRKGADWDATIIKIVEHPISVPQAFWMPYKRVAKLISEQIDKFASSRDKEMQDKANANIEGAGKAATTAPPPAPGAPTPDAPAPFDVGKFAGIFAAIGLAIGAIGSVLAAVLSGFLSLTWWQMPLAVIGVMLLISGPAMLLAWLKLRRRNIGPILDANGWAVNASAKLNIPFGASLTSVAKLPPNAERSLDDPFEEKRKPWALILFVLAALALGAAWKLGYTRVWLDELRRPPTTGAAPAASASAATP